MNDSLDSKKQFSYSYFRNCKLLNTLEAPSSDIPKQRIYSPTANLEQNFSHKKRFPGGKTWMTVIKMRLVNMTDWIW